jgi:Protein of unknown function (DUF3617)
MIQEYLHVAKERTSMNIRMLTTLATLFVLPNLTVAQDAVTDFYMRPGLWEINSTIESSPGAQGGPGGQAGQPGGTAANRLLDRLSPAQRSFLDGILQKRGIQVQSNGNGVQRACVSQAMSLAHEFPFTRSDCEQAQSKQGLTITTTFTCANPRSQGSLIANLFNPEVYSLTLSAEGTTKADRFSMTSAGKFVSPDCGAIRPAR